MIVERLQLRCPDPDGGFYRQHERLALFRPRAVLDQYWTNHWRDGRRRDKLLKLHSDTSLVEYEPLFKKFLSPDGLVVEAGCGLGQVVAALAAHGYRVKGIEYSEPTVSFVNEEFPGLDVSVGDVNALDLDASSVEAYISLGVLEHFETGPERALKEISRVLTRTGRAFVSVPVLNDTRARYLEVGAAPASTAPESLKFYQYYYSVEEFTRLAAAAALKLLEWRGLFVPVHLRNEHPLFSRFWQSRIGRSRLRPAISRQIADPPDWVRRHYAHMSMYVFERM